DEAIIRFHHLQYCLLLVFMLACIHSISKYLGYAILPHGKIYVPERFLAVYVFAEALIWLIAAFGTLSLLALFALYTTVLAFLSIAFVVIISRQHSFYQDIYSGGDLREGFKEAPRSLSFIVNNFCEKFTVDG